MGCAHGKCCLPRGDGGGQRRDGGGVPGGRGGSALGRAAVPGAGLVLEYATLTVDGLYPDSPGRESQDAHLVATRFAADPDLHLFAVFDGHGACGAACSGFARDALPRLLLLAAEDDGAGGSLLATDPAGAFRAAMIGVNEEMHAAAAVDDSMSGTTAVAALVAGATLHVANVGDSRAVAGVWRDGRVAAEDLSWDQTPFRADERARVKACGARVMSVEQVEGVRDPDAEGWLADEGDPPRVWARDGLYPGTAFTRSLGDLAAEGVGVIADPEVKTVEITPAHLFFVVASDGVFEFLSSQEVVDMVAMHQDPRDACAAIAAESYKLWLEHENRTDDITIIIVHIRDAQNSGPAGSDKENSSSTGAPIALHTVQSELPVFVPSELPVFVPSEASHLNGVAAAELRRPSSSSSPSERRLSCVAPSPTHPLLEASRPTQMDSGRTSQPVEARHPREGGNKLEQPLQLQRAISC
ncbi:putative protein phosphatase 2C 65 [Hordeum vulgare]|uniref:protein-serine/threonine phosphatase n=1 Tax=Hordeum vulgare subsp. vulgare TaxID=112509 RepID=A0A8I6WPD8_HORVV|nr:probable protein phosphatase 2C 65 [Hordeum vulgare subsp. vulgare]KAE8817459.1 putative protein phosphatase 2C 65 [Hordeum vulgare]